MREGKSGGRAPKAEAGTEATSAADATPESASDADLRNREAQLKLLQDTVAELTAENKQLKDEVLRLKDQLALQNRD